jgi:hypothetical protein
MKIKMPNAVSTRVARTVLKTQKHSPQFLFYGGLVLMGATVVTACRGTLLLEATLEDIRMDREDVKRVAERDPDKEIGKLNAYVTARGLVRISKLYLPSLALGVAAVACLTTSHTQLSRRNAGLSAALAATDRALKDYRRRVVDEFGEDKDRELMFGSETEKVTQEGSGGKVQTKVKHFGAGRSPYARIWGRDTTSEWDPIPEYNLAKLRSTQEYCTMRLNARGHLFLNEVYDALGLEHTPAGAVCGWQSKKYGGKDGFVDFGVLEEGAEIKFLEFMTGREDHILLDFNVDGEIWRDI